MAPPPAMDAEWPAMDAAMAPPHPAMGHIGDYLESLLSLMQVHRNIAVQSRDAA